MMIERTRVLWFGPDPTQATTLEFDRRNLKLTTVKGALSDDDFAVSCAVVFHFDKSQKGESVGSVKDHASTAVDHGLLTVLCAEDEEYIRLMQAHVVDLPGEAIRYALDRPPYEIAELAARHMPGPPRNSKITIDGDISKPEEVFLLERAFGDCKAIKIEVLKSGRSGATVLSVSAEFPEGDAGPYPLPYVAKIDSRERIIKEYENYKRFVSQYVPFSQRPNFEPQRYVLTHARGILVGDFVENSVALTAVIQPTGARGVIHSLFDDALRGWRQQAYYPGQRAPLSSIRPTVFDPTRVIPAHIINAQRLGSKKSPSELAAQLDVSADYMYRRGPIHGDLNTENIRVRNGEAILIDFYKSAVGPLVADVASLEVAICFSLAANTPWDVEKQGRYAESVDFKEWQHHIDKLFIFLTDQFCLIPPIQTEPSTFGWMWSACRQLRLMAHYIECNEDAYGYVLSAYLLRMAMFAEDEKAVIADKPDATIRAYAYWAAERVLDAITAKKAA